MIVIPAEPTAWAGISAHEPDRHQLVNIGDTQKQVNKALGEPNIEFPDGDKLVRWYAAYEVTIRDGKVVDVKRTQAETAE